MTRHEAFLNLIGSVSEGNLESADKIFQDLITIKLNDTLSDIRQDMAQSLFSSSTEITEEAFNAMTPEEQDEYELVEKTDPCWKGYKQVGMKNKGGKTVPNCVEEDVDSLDEGNKDNKAKKNAHLISRGREVMSSKSSTLKSMADRPGKKLDGLRRSWGTSGDSSNDPLNSSSEKSKHYDEYVGRKGSKLKALKSQKKPNLPESVESLDEGNRENKSKKNAHIEKATGEIGIRKRVAYRTAQGKTDGDIMKLRRNSAVKMAIKKAKIKESVDTNQD